MQTLPSYGSYQAIRLLGRGGMGSVYLAERNDGVFSQQVAIKVLAAHLATHDFEARFLVERQLLSQMQHPNIVRLLDGGISSSGEPYLVTEYVDGVAIDEYCNQRRLPVRDRIRIFLEVCAAVEHAHQNLIVHRDLKPSNILVSLREGHVKLLDFGTAKLLKGREDAIVTEVMLLTPRYASPEQLRKDPITTRSDVYSLGMVLFELLSGQRPFGETSDMLQEFARAYQYTQGRALGQAVTGEDTASRSSSPRELERILSGDLAVICAKALDHDPVHRYATPRQLAEDLESWLDSKPVKARPATVTYRASKFLRRNWPMVGAAFLILIAVLSGIFGTLREKRLATLAPFQSPQARRVKALLTYSYTVARNSLDPKPEFRSTLEALVQEFEALVQQDPRNADNYLNLGKAYQSVARALQRQANASGMIDRGESFTLRARWLAQTRPEEALRWVNLAEMWRLRIPHPARNSIAVQRDWASNLASRATALVSIGEKDEGLAQMKLALKVNESMASAPANLTAKNDLFTVLYNLALMEDELSLPKEFQVVSERMLALAEELIQINPTPQMKFGLHSVLSNLCWAYSTAKDPRADTILARSFALLEKQAKEDPKATTSRTILADLLLNLAHPGYDQADKAFIFANQIAAITPEELGAWELVAMRHLNLQHYPEAVAALERAITCIPAPRAGETPSSLYIKLNERLTRYRAKLATAARQ